MNQFAKPGLAEEKLPPVGTSDNGKVLGVSEGAWAKIPAPSGLPEIGEGDTGKVLTATAEGAAWQSGGSSGGGVFVVTLTEVDGVLTSDKTAGEIYAACPAVSFIAPGAELGYTVGSLTGYFRIEDGQYAGFHEFLVAFFDQGQWHESEYAAASADDPVALND